MPRRRVLTDTQLEALLALPTDEADLIQHYSLGAQDLAVIMKRRRPHNQLGFALQLCALRFPGRLLRPGEVVPIEVARFVADQLDINPASLADYATRAPTRYDQLETLRGIFGFRSFSQPDRRELSAWLVPIALTTVSGTAVASALMVELRRRGIAAPGVTVIERMVATALLRAERQVADLLSRGLTEVQRTALDALLEIHARDSVSNLAWARHPAGAPGHRSLSRLIEQLKLLRNIGIDDARIAAVHPQRIKQLAQEGTRLTAQHLTTLSPGRRRAILVVTVIETSARLTDDTIGIFDRLIGRLFRRAEQRASETLKNDARAMNEKIRLFARIGDALLGARASGEDPFAAIGDIIPWDRFAETITEAKSLVRSDGPDYLALAERNHALLRRIGPLFLNAFTFQGVVAVGGLIRALELMRAFYSGSRRALPKDLPSSFIRRGWRQAVSKTAKLMGRPSNCAFSPSFATGSGPVTSGSPAAGNIARSRTSSSPGRYSLQ